MIHEKKNALEFSLKYHFPSRRVGRAGAGGHQGALLSPGNATGVSEGPSQTCPWKSTPRPPWLKSHIARVLQFTAAPAFHRHKTALEGKSRKRNP